VIRNSSTVNIPDLKPAQIMSKFASLSRWVHFQRRSCSRSGSILHAGLHVFMISFLSKGVQGINRIVGQRSNDRVFFNEAQCLLRLSCRSFQQVANTPETARTVAHSRTTSLLKFF
jgi:hypothetical protein